MADKTIQLRGRVFVTFNIEAATGLHIGGSDTGIEIGGVDKTIIRDRITNRPYIPGSSLKGKMRSLLEKYKGLKQNQPVGQSTIHSCGAEYKKDEQQTKGKAEYQACDVCQVFGVPGEREFGVASPTRLVVRDVMMTDASASALNENGRTELPYSEVKTEVSIDRVTSAANPRQMERVPAGTIFGPAELVFSIYAGEGCDPVADVARLKTLVEGLQLLEDDYLGGLGSRGSGKVRFQDIQLTLRTSDDYLAPPLSLSKAEKWNLNDLVAELPGVQNQVRSALHLG
ncbi:MAG: type III-A CRISPR-associated RAMP protein Csm3 [Caldilineaceae bacterium]|nr:type III-A CRISPR-associated RAMP protein Csm3 [Caldilineaceae bacterium]